MARTPLKNDSTEDGVAVDPVVALCSITYGSAITVAPGTIFAPVSDSERKELFGLKAVRDLDDAEEALFQRDGGGAVTETKGTPEPAPIPDPANPDPIG